MSMFEMHFYVIKTKDGLYHVQNYVMGLRGQHHIHNEKSFNKWKKDIAEKFLHISEGSCNCELTKSGDVKDREGNISHNERFE